MLGPCVYIAAGWGWWFGVGPVSAALSSSKGSHELTADFLQALFSFHSSARKKQTLYPLSDFCATACAPREALICAPSNLSHCCMKSCISALVSVWLVVSSHLDLKLWSYQTFLAVRNSILLWYHGKQKCQTIFPFQTSDHVSPTWHARLGVGLKVLEWLSLPYPAVVSLCQPEPRGSRCLLRLM